MAVEWKQHIGEGDGVLGGGGSELILVGDEQDILCEWFLEGLRVRVRKKGGGIRGGRGAVDWEQRFRVSCYGQLQPREKLVLDIHD